MPGRVLAVGLDGFDITQATRWFERGELPALAHLRTGAATFLLEGRHATRTGLSWEHFASGLTPADAGRSSAVEFDGARYRASQEGARFEPFFAHVDCNTMVFDAPYARLDQTDRATGLVAWGAHDPGTLPMSSPPELVGAMEMRFGAYPARRWTYATPWPCPDETTAMGQGLVKALEVRTEVAVALLAEQDWELAVVVAGEPHSAAEALWHGVDPDHALSSHPSAPAAADGFSAVMRAVDRMVGVLVEVADADAVVVFSLGGMGINSSDIPSMVLLPELVYRWSTGEQLLQPPAAWTAQPDLPPIIPPDDNWDSSIAKCYPPPHVGPMRRLAHGLPIGAGRTLRNAFRARSAPPSSSLSVDWIPASRYRARWSEMKAFALPSFYDGRIRVNLRGRESQGIVEPADYESLCEELEQLVRACRDPRTGESVVAEVERAGDPMACSGSDGDLVVVWHGSPWAFRHPEHGLVGPVPYRRTGGHTGPHGFAYVAAPGVEPGERGMRSVFDVPPTLVDLLGHTALPGVAGTSMIR